MVGNVTLPRLDIRQVARCYGLDIVDSEPLPRGWANSSFLLRTLKGSFVLTVFQCGPHLAIQLGQLLRHLASHDFPTTRVLPTLDDDLVTSLHDKPVMLKVYIHGCVLPYPDEAMLHQVGRALATLHGIDAPGYLGNRHPYELRILPRVLGQGIDPVYESWLSDSLARLRPRIRQDLPKGLIHGDLFFDNVLFAGGRFRAMIDFELACRYLKVFDIAMAIVGLCAQPSGILFGKVRSLLRGYQQVRPLEAGERAGLQATIDYAATATSAWRFWKCHIDTPGREHADRHLRMMQLADAVRAVPEAECIERIFG